MRDRRIPSENSDADNAASLAGMMLLAHPTLKSEHFRRTVVLMAAHTPQDGAMGVIINRPMGMTLGELDPDFALSPLRTIPVYEGGPVDKERIIFASWHWDAAHRRLRMHFGIEKEFAEQSLMENPDTHVRGFLGYAGWEKNQLEGELAVKTWAVAKVDAHLLETADGITYWRAMIGRASPELKLLSESPDEPKLN